MAERKTILVGTVGQEIMRSPDGGETWQRVGINQGLHFDPLVRTLANHLGQAGGHLCGRRSGPVPE